MEKEILSRALAEAEERIHEARISFGNGHEVSGAFGAAQANHELLSAIVKYLLEKDSD